MSEYRTTAIKLADETHLTYHEAIVWERFRDGQTGSEIYEDLKHSESLNSESSVYSLKHVAKTKRKRAKRTLKENLPSDVPEEVKDQTFFKTAAQAEAVILSDDGADMDTIAANMGISGQRVDELLATAEAIRRKARRTTQMVND